MESNIKACIINASWGGWYSKGSERLKQSLIYHGFHHDILIWKNEKINEFFNEKQPYTIKLAALHEAIKLGYTHILWLDSSVWALQNPEKIFDIINDEGGYFWKSGFNMAQCSADSDLNFANWSRDYAEGLNELSSSMFGLNLKTPKGKEFVKVFTEAANYGVFGTSRLHNNASNDERFLHARQDQTAATIAFYKSGFDKIYNPGEYSSYYSENLNESIIFTMRGM